jgi:hypothetical protein
VGVRLFLEKDAVVSLEAALPLTKVVASRSSNAKDARLLGSLLLRF